MIRNLDLEETRDGFVGHRHIGKSAAIVLDDADLSPQLEQIFSSTLANTGQTWLYRHPGVGAEGPLRRGGQHVQRPRRRLEGR